MTDSRIAAVELIPLELPLTRPFAPSWTPGRVRRTHALLLARLTVDAGAQGIGATVGFSGGRLAAGLEQECVDRFVGLDLFDEAGWAAHLQGLAMFGMPRPWFLDIARWDLIGKLSDQPVYRLLGGVTDVVEAYVSTGELRPAPQRVEDVLRFVEAGFRAVKLRFHEPDPNTDFEVFDAVVDAVGDRVQVAVDANQGWALYPRPHSWDVRSATAIAERLADAGTLWLEEPLDRHNLAGLAELRRRSRVPIAGGEMNVAPDDLRRLIQGRCLDILQPDAVFAGGITGVRQILDEARAAGLRYTPHAWSNGVGLLANLHLAAAAGGRELFEYPWEPGCWEPEHRDFVLTEPITTDAQGRLRLPKQPGLGIELDEERMDAYRIDR